ncbi:MAG TPA: gliding motility lipoprotein GldH [Bacteroidales bacterium]|nr:gliding motility lipoprotein GldH [Bacteroidales bacterium]
MIKRRNKYSSLLLLPFLLLLTSCHNNVVYTDSFVIPDKSWELMNVPVFEVPINDTVCSNNIIFTIRTSSSYPFRNIYLFVTTTSPAGVNITDTLQYNLADEKGKWYGKGFGDIHELNLPYKSNVYFPIKGTYTFKVQHGMRTEDLKGVYDFGLRVVKINK